MGRSDWAAEYTPTPAQFVDRYYDAADRSDVLARLRAEGLRRIAHTLWVTKQAVDADVILLQFGTPRDAQSRLLFVTGASEHDSKLAHYRLAVRGNPLVYYDKQLDDLGDVIAKVYARIGDVVLEIFVGSPARLDRRDVARWTKAQLAKLAAA
jgi:hypothetical protein